MTLFSRILDFRKSDLKKVERRFGKRYPVGPVFPLTASLEVAGQTFAGVVQNLSGEGLGFAADRDPGVSADGAARVALRLGDFNISLRAGIKHVKPAGPRFRCGIALAFDAFETRKSYLQLMLPVVVGASLQKMEGGLIRQDEPAFHKQVFAGDSLSKLTVWSKRDTPRSPDSFEFRMDEYYVKGRTAPRLLQTFSLTKDERPHQVQDTTPLFYVSSRLDEEIKQLFRWSVLNLQDNVPADLRDFLGSFAG